VAYIEIEDYLVLEEASAYKHEYLDGVIYAIQGEPARGMAGGSQAHARLIRNTVVALHRQLAGSPCEVLASEMRLRVHAASAVFYPDVMVHCQGAGPVSTTTELKEARLVVEVLSPSTQLFDRGAKLQAFQLLPGLQQVLLLSSMEQAAWACVRLSNGTWSALEPWERGTTLAPPDLGLSLAWDEVYGGVGLT
jgi:Uma2 family endonuclease